MGVMCFKGLDLHLDDIKNLLEASPKTTMILDHFGFTSCTEKGDAAFQDLLELAKYPQVVVKISALFRLSDSSPYEKVKRERFEPLLKTFGPSRLMYGSDFPFVLEQEPEKYEGMVNLVSSWMEDDSVRSWVMGKTAEVRRSCFEILLFIFLTRPSPLCLTLGFSNVALVWTVELLMVQNFSKRKRHKAI